MTSERQPEDRKSSPGMAKLISIAILAMAGYSQVTTGEISGEMTAGLVGLVAIWLGVGADRFLGS